MSDKLPRGWVWASVFELSLMVTSGSRDWSQYYSEKGAYFVRSAEINDYSFRLSEAIRVALPKNVEGKRTRIGRGDILVTITGANVGKCAKVDTEPAEAYVSQSVALIKLLDKDLTPFIYYSLRAHTIGEQQLAKMAYGVGRPVLSLPQIREVRIPLAPLNEQRRIVAKLEKILVKVNACQKRLERIPVLLKRFRQSVLAAACSGRLTVDWRIENSDAEPANDLLERLRRERRDRFYAAYGERRYKKPQPMRETDLPDIPASWSWTNFDQCCWEITVGHVGPMKDRYTTGGVPFLRSQNVRPLRFDSNGLTFIPAVFDSELKKSRLIGGELLVTRSGANTGDCCVFPSHLGAANCSDLVISRPLSGLLAHYAAIYVSSPEGQARLSVRQTGIAQPHFNIGAMKIKPFPLPPFSEQQEIVRRVDGLFAFADQIEARYVLAKAHVDKLIQSVLAKAFRGELVPQDPNDEPASVLLERLRLNGRM